MSLNLYSLKTVGLSQFLHLSIETYTWTWINLVAVSVSLLLFYLFGIVTNVLPATGQGEFYAMCYILAQPIIWLIGRLAQFDNFKGAFSGGDVDSVRTTAFDNHSLLSCDQSSRMVSP